MDKRARAHHAERLLSDDVLEAAFTAVSERYQRTFRDASATSDDVLEARLMFFALEQVKANLRSYVTDGKILEAKDQHRVID